MEEAGWGGGALEDYLLKAQCKLISTLPESTAYEFRKCGPEKGHRDEK